MKLRNIEKKLLRELFKSSDGLFIFTLYQRFNISPKDLFLVIDNLRQFGLIDSENDRITLTKPGVEFVLNNKISFIKAKSKYEKIPKEFVGPRIEINQFYIPRLSLNSKK